MNPRNRPRCPQRPPGVTRYLLVAALLTIVGCTHKAAPTASVTVEEYVSNLPTGATVRLCLQRLPCQTNVISENDRSAAPHIVTLWLPDGVSLRDANGWTVHGESVARGITYRGTARVTYLVAVDPPCKCTGDYVHLYFQSTRR